MHTEYPHNITEQAALLAAGKLYSLLKNDSSITFSEDEIKKAIHITQVMFDINLKHLIGLRAECDISHTDTQNEIRFLENKLVRVFAQQLITRRRGFIAWEDNYELRNIASFVDWLKMIGLDDRGKQIFLEQFDDIEDYLRIDDDKLTDIILIGHGLNKEEYRVVLEKLSAFQFDIFKQPKDMRVFPVADVSPDDRSFHVVENVKRLWKAQKCLRVCLSSLEGGEELSHTIQFFWDSWGYWPKKTNGFKWKRKASADGGDRRFLPQPLPPLPSLCSRIANCRGVSAKSSKSTGSSPLSPPPAVSSLSAASNSSGYSYRPSTTISTSSSSSSIIPPNFNLSNNVLSDANSPASRRHTPPSTPPTSHHRKFFLNSSLIFSHSRKNSDAKFPSTPPATRRNPTNVDQFPLTKSKSHEEQLSNRIDNLDPALMNKLWKKYNLPFGGKTKKQTNSLDNLPHLQAPYRRRLATEPGSLGSTSPILSLSNCSSPISPDNQMDKQSDCFTDNGSPKSPRSSKIMHHSIHHRFVTAVKINTICAICDKQMYLGLKCRDCKFYVHRECSLRAPKSCGLPGDYFNVFKHSISENDSRSPSVSSHKSLSSLSFSSLHRNKNNFIQLTSSVRSCSNPSSPAIFTSYTSTSISPTLNTSFQFPPDITLNGNASSEGSLVEEPPSKAIGTIHEEDEIQRIPTIQLTTSAENSVDSDKTLTAATNSLDSQNGDTVAALTVNEKPEWPRQNSAREWDIPYDELMLEEEIGAGRFGKVFRGQWHGQVAIKRIDLADKDDRLTLDAFKREVATFRKTRHDNLILFMGACMKPPHLAVVTEFCKGLTLHTHIHVRRDRFNLNRTILIAEQVCLGMGYLHARGIIHKDLKSKNIFYENGKVVITDFGLSSVSKLCVTDKRGDWLTVPKGWLCYLAPEIIQTLNIGSNETANLPFTFKTDAYAFGTVWHELLFGCWPFSGQPSEVIIWQIGKGVKQPLNQQASKEAKDLLYQCWSFNPDERLDFPQLYDQLQKLPKKRLQRSPSHPTQLQHTLEQHF